MKCEKCGKEIQAGEKYYTAIGVIQCEDCNTKSNGTVSLDFIIDKIKNKTESKIPVNHEAIKRIADEIKKDNGLK